MSLPPFLPVNVAEPLASIGESLVKRRSIAPIQGLANLFDKIDPVHLPRAERAIVHHAKLFHWRRKPRFFLKLLGLAPTDMQQLGAVAGLEYVFIFHRDGRIREAALHKINGALSSGFLLAAIAQRLNDWAVPVRRAAHACAERTFPRTDPEIVADAAVALLLRHLTWQRWQSEKAVLEKAFARLDVIEALAARVINHADGPMASLLRAALRFDGMDRHLERIAIEARQPETRALAFETLISGYATWKIGHHWRWIDKSMGVRRREPTFARRAVTSSPDTLRLIREALHDRNTAVRKVAASALIAHRADFKDVTTLATGMLVDRCSAVRERAMFLLEQVALEEKNPPDSSIKLS